MIGDAFLTLFHVFRDILARSGQLRCSTLHAISRVPGHFGLLWIATLALYTLFQCSGTFLLALDSYAARLYMLFHVFWDILACGQLGCSTLHAISRVPGLFPGKGLGPGFSLSGGLWPSTRTHVERPRRIYFSSF